METPSSTTRRVTRSQTLAAFNNSANNTKKIEDGAETRMGNKKQDQQQDRSALIDITNDSPIVGLAARSLETPLSGLSKQRSSVAVKRTPGSGEALLRGQVKTLLQRVEEEAELSKLENHPVIKIQGLVSSPIIAVTPANTPQVPNLYGSGLDLVSSLPVVQETMDISQVIMASEEPKDETMEAEKSVTRSLMLDFSSEKSEASEMVPSTTVSDDESASIWSIQANAGSITQDEEEADEDEDDYEIDDNYGYEEGEEDERIDEICIGMRKINMECEFKGKHTRFVYNSDDEIEKVEIVQEEDGVLRLKGLPTPKGKHSRFHSEDDEC